MCMSFKESKMSKTLVYAGEGERQGKTVHVLAYQNTATSHGPNAMILPFPTDTSMSQENVLDTRAFPSFLKNISNASKIQTRGMKGLTLGGIRTLGIAEVFDVGSYTVVLAENVDQIPDALKRVPQNKRPTVNVPFLMGFGALYPDSPIALCCWDGAIESEPLLWWFEPRAKNALFLPTMDAHDGKAPRLGVKVSTDHIVSIGLESGPITANVVRYEDTLTKEARGLLPTHVWGGRLPDRMFNGDVYAHIPSIKSAGSNYPKWVRGYADEIQHEGSFSGWH
jgi:hypothetical protein